MYYKITRIPVFRISNYRNFTRESKVQFQLDNQNICAKAKLCLILFMPALEILCRKSEVRTAVSFD